MSSSPPSASSRAIPSSPSPSATTVRTPARTQRTHEAQLLFVLICLFRLLNFLPCGVAAVASVLCGHGFRRASSLGVAPCRIDPTPRPGRGYHRPHHGNSTAGQKDKAPRALRAGRGVLVAGTLFSSMRLPRRPFAPAGGPSLAAAAAAPGMAPTAGDGGGRALRVRSGPRVPYPPPARVPGRHRRRPGPRPRSHGAHLNPHLEPRGRRVRGHRRRRGEAPPQTHMAPPPRAVVRGCCLALARCALGQSYCRATLPLSFCAPGDCGFDHRPRDESRRESAGTNAQQPRRQVALR